MPFRVARVSEDRYPLLPLQPDWEPLPCTITGTSGNYVLPGTPGDDAICSLDGDDQIDGAGGNAIIKGGPGNDTIAGGTGSGNLFGESGNDILNAKDGVRHNDLAHDGEGIDQCMKDRKDRRISCP